MAYVDVPKDLSKVQTKVTFGLTKRQLICFGIGAAIGLPVYILTFRTLGTTVSALLLILIIMPCFIMAVNIGDEPPEQKLKHIINANILNPGIRPYKSVNFYEVLEKASKEDVNFVSQKEKYKSPKGQSKNR